MSAASELVLEQIEQTQKAIKNAIANGLSTTNLERDLAFLNEKLAASQQALTEGKNLLKG